MNKIYLIVWTGRDCDSGVWDNYPYFEAGFFTSKQKAQEWADYMNETSEFDYDEDAEDTPSFQIMSVVRNDESPNQKD